MCVICYCARKHVVNTTKHVCMPSIQHISIVICTNSTMQIIFLLVDANIANAQLHVQDQDVPPPPPYVRDNDPEAQPLPQGGYFPAPDPDQVI